MYVGFKCLFVTLFTLHSLVQFKNKYIEEPTEDLSEQYHNEVTQAISFLPLPHSTVKLKCGYGKYVICCLEIKGVLSDEF